MFEKVLVPLDGSKVGEAALPVVKLMAKDRPPGSKMQVTLIQVVTVLRHWVVVGEASAPVSYTEEELEFIKGRVNAYLNKTSEALKSDNIDVDIVVASGNAADEVLRVAEEAGVELIAMSTHGRSGLRRWAFGSVTDKVLRRSRTPVLLVRAPKGTINE